MDGLWNSYIQHLVTVQAFFEMERYPLLALTLIVVHLLVTVQAFLEEKISPTSFNLIPHLFPISAFPHLSSSESGDTKISGAPKVDQALDLQVIAVILCTMSPELRNTWITDG